MAEEFDYDLIAREVVKTEIFKQSVRDIFFEIIDNYAINEAPKKPKATEGERDINALNRAVTAALATNFPHMKSKTIQPANVTFPENITIKSQVSSDLEKKEEFVEQFNRIMSIGLWEKMKEIISEKDSIDAKIKTEMEKAKSDTNVIITQMKSDAIQALSTSFKTNMDNVSMFINFDEISKTLTANTNAHFEKIDTQLNSLSQVLQNELMIIKRVLWNNSIVTNSSSKDLKLTKCMNYDLHTESGWASCKYLNCNHAGPGDFVSYLLGKLEVLSTEPYDRILNIKACAYHENMIQVNHQFTILSKTSIYQEYTSYLSITRATGDITRSNFYKLALSMIPSTLNRISLYNQLVKDLFCSLQFDDNKLVIPTVQSFNELIKHGRHGDTSGYTITFEVNQTDIPKLRYQQSGGIIKDYDNVFERHFKYFKDSSIFAVIFPTENVKNISNKDFKQLLSKTIL